MIYQPISETRWSQEKIQQREWVTIFMITTGDVGCLQTQNYPIFSKVSKLMNIH